MRIKGCLIKLDNTYVNPMNITQIWPVKGENKSGIPTTIGCNISFNSASGNLAGAYISFTQPDSEFKSIEEVVNKINNEFCLSIFERGHSHSVLQQDLDS